MMDRHRSPLRFVLSDLPSREPRGSLEYPHVTLRESATGPARSEFDPLRLKTDPLRIKVAPQELQLRSKTQHRWLPALGSWLLAAQICIFFARGCAKKTRVRTKFARTSASPGPTLVLNESSFMLGSPSLILNSRLIRALNLTTIYLSEIAGGKSEGWECLRLIGSDPESVSGRAASLVTRVRANPNLGAVRVEVIHSLGSQ